MDDRIRLRHGPYIVMGWEIELTDGSVAKLTLTFRSLFELRESENHKIYEEYTKIRKKEHVDELDMAYLVYVAYICAGNDHKEFEEFLDLLPPDRSVIAHAVDMLLEPKKKRDLLKRLKSGLMSSRR